MSNPLAQIRDASRAQRAGRGSKFTDSALDADAQARNADFRGWALGQGTQPAGNANPLGRSDAEQQEADNAAEAAIEAWRQLNTGGSAA